MAKQEILEKCRSLKVWARGDKLAPHQPRLLQMTPGTWQQGEAALSFEPIGRQLTELLREFSPERKGDHPELPFHHLQNDDVWRMAAGGQFMRQGKCTDWRRSQAFKGKPRHAIG